MVWLMMTAVVPLGCAAGPEGAEDDITTYRTGRSGKDASTCDGGCEEGLSEAECCCGDITCNCAHCARGYTCWKAHGDALCVQERTCFSNADCSDGGLACSVDGLCVPPVEPEADPGCSSTSAGAPQGLLIGSLAALLLAGIRARRCPKTRSRR